MKTPLSINTIYYNIIQYIYCVKKKRYKSCNFSEAVKKLGNSARRGNISLPTGRQAKM
jgi:hypothetical protein